MTEKRIAGVQASDAAKQQTAQLTVQLATSRSQCAAAVAAQKKADEVSSIVYALPVSHVLCAYMSLPRTPAA